MDTSFKDSLSTRAQWGLRRCFGDEGLDNPQIIVNGRERLRIAVNLGQKSLQEIAFLLCKLGYIDDIERWLG
ncbi:hypothetical protein ACFLYW_01025 [Thermodesulfobacteriota bacterium]